MKGWETYSYVIIFTIFSVKFVYIFVTTGQQIFTIYFLLSLFYVTADFFIARIWAFLKFMAITNIDLFMELQLSGTLRASIAVTFLN